MFDWIWSDQHFGHKNILKFTHRPYKTVQAMDQALIKNFNKCVKPGEKVLWLGDCFFTKPDRSAQIMRSLPGDHHLVIGNHDRSPAQMLEMGFKTVVDRAYFEIGGRVALACHYPYYDPREDSEGGARYIDRRPKPVKGQVLLHGHTHDLARQSGLQIHLGVDAWDCFPVHWDTVERMVRKL